MKYLILVLAPIVIYAVLVGLNASVGYRECFALAIHNDIGMFSPCGLAYALRG